MTVFNTLLPGAIFNDPNFGVAAVYLPLTGESLPVTIIWETEEDDSLILSGMATRLRKTLCNVRVSEMPDPQRGDQLSIEGVTYVVGNRERDQFAVEWRLDLKPAP